VYATCLRSDAGTSRAFAATQSIGTSLSVLRSFCPFDQALTGGGYRTGWEKPPAALPQIVASLPDPALSQTWIVAGEVMKQPNVAAPTAPMTAYAACIGGAITTRTTMSKQLVFDPGLPGCTSPASQTAVCTAQAHLTCDQGPLTVGAQVPFQVAANGTLDTSQWDRDIAVSVSRPGDPASSANVNRWTVVAQIYYFIGPPPSKRQQSTVVVCAAPLVPTSNRTNVAVPVPIGTPPPIAAPDPPSTGGFRNLAAVLQLVSVRDMVLAVLAVLLLLTAVVIARAVRRRAKRRRTRRVTGAAQVLVDPGTPTHAIRMDGPHLAVTARFDPSTGTYTWRERTS
jgi:hypothetical protein